MCGATQNEAIGDDQGTAAGNHPALGLRCMCRASLTEMVMLFRCSGIARLEAFAQVTQDDQAANASTSETFNCTAGRFVPPQPPCW